MSSRAGTTRKPAQPSFDDVLADAVAGFTTTGLVRVPAGPGEPPPDPQLDPLLEKSYKADLAGSDEAAGSLTVPAAYVMRLTERLKSALPRIRYFNRDKDLRLKIQWIRVGEDEEHKRRIPETQWKTYTTEDENEEIEVRFLVHEPRDMGRRVAGAKGASRK
jgi:hypothetical protein